MNPLLADVLQVLRLERLELDLFRGESRDPGHRRVFGGQVLGSGAHGGVSRRSKARRAFAARVLPARRRSRLPDRLRGRPQPRRHQLLLAPGGRDPARRADLPHVGFVSDRGGRDRPPGRDAARAGSRVAARHGGRGRGTEAQGAGSAAAVPCAKKRVRVPAGRVAGSDCGDPQGTAHEDLVPGDRPRSGRSEVLHRCLLAYASDYYLLGAAGMDARLSVSRKRAADGEHRPRDVVSPSGACRTSGSCMCWTARQRAAPAAWRAAVFSVATGG